MRAATRIELTSEEQAELAALVRSKLASVRLALRKRIVLLAAQRMQNMDIAAKVGVGRVQISRWRERYSQSRLAGIESDLPRGALPVNVDVARLVELTTDGKPKSATYWSTQTMAAELGISAASVSRHWRAKGLKPHLVHSFKVSRDPKFVEKLEDIDGKVISTRQQRHRHDGWLKFLKKIDRETPKDKTLHLIAGNYATHKHPNVQEWLEKYPRFNMHFTPTSASWLNMVERFRDISENRLRRGMFCSVPELSAAIDEYVAHHNSKPKPFNWTASAHYILQNIIRANRHLNSKQNATLH